MNTIFSKNHLILITTLFLSATIFACDVDAKLQPEEIVKNFWEYCSKSKLDEATKLTCLKRDCIDPENTERQLNESNIETSAVDENGNRINPNKNRREPVLEFPYNAKLIIDWKISRIKIVEVKNSKYSAQVIVEAESQFGKTLKFVNCLRKERDSESWKIESTNTAEIFDIDNDPCLLNIKTG